MTNFVLYHQFFIYDPIFQLYKNIIVTLFR